MKNPNDPIGYPAPDLPACSAVPQPTAPPRAPKYELTRMKFRGQTKNKVIQSDSGCNVNIFGNEPAIVRGKGS
jgi:hypothetical protein